MEADPDSPEGRAWHGSLTALRAQLQADQSKPLPGAAGTAALWNAVAHFEQARSAHIHIAHTFHTRTPRPHAYT